MIRILFAAGGSIGHIAPCVAIWEAVKNEDATATVTFACSSRPEDGEFLRKNGIPFAIVGERNVRLWTIPMMFVRAWKILGRENPNVIVTKGGGITIPIALAGWMRGIPIIAHESDAVDGRSTKFIARFAKTAVHGFPANPVRKEIASGSQEQGLRITGLKGRKPVLLIMGGSQGAAALNDATKNHLEELLRSVEIIHVTGAGKTGATPIAGKYWTCEFAHDEYPHLLAAADIALCRAGAGTISELAARELPAILVPLRGLAHDHQERNAREIERAGACIVLEQTDLDRELVMTVGRIAEARERMATAMRSLHKQNTSENVTKFILAAAVKRCGVS